jgi:arylsulfatase A-like enzyme
VILVVVDNLRADHLGAYGYARETSPHFDELSRRGWLFTRAFSPSSWTKPAVASLFTSREPDEHGAVSFARHLRADLPTLAEVYAAAGYDTVGVSGNFVHVNAAAGLARGFQEFTVLSFPVTDPAQDAILSLPSEQGGSVRVRAPRAEEVNRAALQALDAVRKRPLFLYLHFMDPHAGFDPPPGPLRRVLGAEVRSSDLPTPATADEVVALARAGEPVVDDVRRRLMDLYDGEIAALDAALGELWSALQARGRRTLLAVVSDHGEEFGEHGGFFHGRTLHAELLHVPFLLVDTAAPDRAGRRHEAVDLLDLAPTLLSLSGIATPTSMRGRDLSRVGAPKGRALVAELHCDARFESHAGPRQHWSALTHWPWKALVTPDAEVWWFDLEHDPQELGPAVTDLSGAPPEVRRAVDELAARTWARDAKACDGPTAFGPSELERLRALGYAE